MISLDMAMRNSVKLALLMALAMTSPAVSAPQLSPLQAYNANIAEENRDYAKIPHAMLKIQAAAYLGDGDNVTLIGQKGEPGSWHWAKKAMVQGPLAISYKGGQLMATLYGRLVSPAEITRGISIDSEIDVVGQPTQVNAGVNGWRIFVYNQKNSAATKFTGVSYYPFDPTYRVEASFMPDLKLPPHVFRTSRGTSKQFYHAGDASFSLNGVRVTLPFYAESNKLSQIKDLSAFYTDQLTGRGAYGAGRYVDVADFDKFPPAKVIIDFNQAYNPNCARSPYFTCPVAVDNVPIAVAAGERDPHMPH
jgi:hypothetical protein